MLTAFHRQTAAPLAWEVISEYNFWKKLCISGLCFVGSTCSINTYAQDCQRASQFKAHHAWSMPLRIEPRLSGNFGELRGGHFHTGLDFKTEGREGLVVLAATDGRVSRVKMSPWGYGNALYLDGPDGITTLYAHLQKFAPQIQKWAIERSYEGRHLGLDASPATDLTFQAGDTIGWSGNSGGSGGPHLHFEVRNTSNQHPLNPLDGWVTKIDTRPPVLPTLWAESDQLMREWNLSEVDTVLVPTLFRLSVEGYDVLNGAPNICGLHELQAVAMSQNGNELMSYKASWTELDFSVNKDMNAHAFYPIWGSQRKQVHRLHRLATNRLGIYDSPPHSGWLQLKPKETSALQIRAIDASGNETMHEVVLKADPECILNSNWKLKDMPWEGETKVVEPGTSGRWETAMATIAWEANTFFESVGVGWSMNDEHSGGTLFPSMVPFKKTISVTWNVPKTMDPKHGFWSALSGNIWPADKWLAVQRSDKGNVLGTAKAEVVEGRATMWLAEGGVWNLERDTVAPRVLPYHSGTPLISDGDAVWFVEDELSGIDELQLTLDGVWARLVWDPKRNMVTYEHGDGVHSANRPVKAVLTTIDKAGNAAKWTGLLSWP